VKGLLSYHRGAIRILNREGLEAIACDCYPIIKRLYANLYRGEGLLPNTDGNRFASGGGRGRGADCGEGVVALGGGAPRPWDLPRAMELGGAAEVFGRGEAGEFAEVVDEVCLVGIAEVEGELRAVEGLAGVEAFEQLVKTKAADDPFGKMLQRRH